MILFPGSGPHRDKPHADFGMYSRLVAHASGTDKDKSR